MNIGGNQPAGNNKQNDGDKDSGLALNQSDMVMLVSAIAAEMSNQINTPAVDPLAYYKFLEDAVEGRWKV